jgi:hypothetical protein
VMLADVGLGLVQVPFEMLMQPHHRVSLSYR